MQIALGWHFIWSVRASGIMLSFSHFKRNSLCCDVQ